MAIATHINDILRRGQQDVPLKTRVYPAHRFGGLEVRESPFVLVAMEPPQEGDFSVELIWEAIATNWGTYDASPEIWAARRRPLAPEDIGLRQCKLDEPCCVARLGRTSVPRPDIRARLERVDSLRVSDVYLIYFLVGAVNVCRQATVLKDASLPNPGAPARGDFDGGMLARREKINCGTMSTVRWSDVAYGDQSSEGRSRSGYAIGLMSSTLNGPCRTIPWTSEFAKEWFESSLGFGVRASSETVDHVSILRKFYEPLAALPPGMIGFGDCESLISPLGNKKSAAEKHLVRGFFGIQLSSGSKASGSVYWFPGLANPDDGLTRVKSGMVRPLR